MRIIYYKVELEGNNVEVSAADSARQIAYPKVSPNNMEVLGHFHRPFKTHFTSCPNTLSGSLRRQFCVQFGASNPNPRASRVGPRSQVCCERQREPSVPFQEQSQNHIRMRFRRSENVLSKTMSRLQMPHPSWSSAHAQGSRRVEGKLQEKRDCLTFVS